jgi:hypothetical protein
MESDLLGQNSYFTDFPKAFGRGDSIYTCLRPKSRGNHVIHVAGDCVWAQDSIFPMPTPIFLARPVMQTAKWAQYG